MCKLLNDEWESNSHMFILSLLKEPSKRLEMYETQNVNNTLNVLKLFIMI